MKMTHLNRSGLDQLWEYRIQADAKCAKVRRMNVPVYVIYNLLVGVFLAVNCGGKHKDERSFWGEYVPGDVLSIFQRNRVEDDIDERALGRLRQLGPEV